MRIVDGFEFNHFEVDLVAEVLGRIEDVGDTSRHSSGEVATGTSENDNSSSGHVLTTVISASLDDSGRSRVSNSESFGGDTSEEGLSTSRAVQANVSDDDVLRKSESDE